MSLWIIVKQTPKYPRPRYQKQALAGTTEALQVPFSKHTPLCLKGNHYHGIYAIHFLVGLYSFMSGDASLTPIFELYTNVVINVYIYSLRFIFCISLNIFVRFKYDGLCSWSSLISFLLSAPSYKYLFISWWPQVVTWFFSNYWLLQSANDTANDTAINIVVHICSCTCAHGSLTYTYIHRHS